MNKKTDKWIEIISVRLFNPEARGVVREIFRKISREVSAEKSPVPEKAMAVELYENQKVETDWSIYLYQSGWDGSASKSRLGLSIAEAFSSLGLVNHSVWTMDLMKKETTHE